MLFILIVVICVFILINVLCKLLGYSIKAKKYGIRTKAEIIGYYCRYSGSDILGLYPVVKFKKINGEEVIAQSRVLLVFPVYRVGEIIPIEYYVMQESNLVAKNVYFNVFKFKSGQVLVDTSMSVNLLGVRWTIDVVIEILILLLVILIKIVID